MARSSSSEPARCLRVAPARAWNAADVRTAGDPSSDALTAALAVTQSDSPDPAHVGEDVTYTVQVHNGGPDDAEAVTLSDRIPDASTFQTATPSTGTCSEAAGWVTCDLGSLAADGDASVAITVRPGAAGTNSNVASVSSTTDDPDHSDNAALEQTTVVESAAAALAVTQADSPDPVQVGEDVTYTVQVHNGGPDDAEAVTLTDTLPGASTFQSATPSTGTCSKTGGTVTCDLGFARRRRRCFRGHHRQGGRSRHDQQRRVGLLDHRRSRRLRQHRSGADDRARSGADARAHAERRSPDPVCGRRGRHLHDRRPPTTARGMPPPSTSTTRFRPAPRTLVGDARNREAARKTAGTVSCAIGSAGCRRELRRARSSSGRARPARSRTRRP